MTLFDTSDEWIVERTGIRERRAADGPFVNPKPPAIATRRDGHHGPTGSRSRSRRARNGRPRRSRHRPADSLHDQPRPDGPGNFLAPGKCTFDQGRRHGHKCGLRRLYVRARYRGGVHHDRGGAGPSHRRRDPDPDNQLVGPHQRFPVRRRRRRRGRGSGARRTGSPGLGHRRGRVVAAPFLCGLRLRDDHAGPGGVPQSRAGNGGLGDQEPGAGQTHARATSPFSCPIRPTSGLWTPWPNASACPSDRIASVIERTGNTSSASIPIALTEAANDGRLKDGDIVLFAGFGAGMTWASAVWRWGANPAR